MSSSKRLEAEEISAGGIVLPDTAKEKPQEAEVRRPRHRRQGRRWQDIEFTVKVGDKVLISKYGGTEVKIDGEELLIISRDRHPRHRRLITDLTTYNLQY